MKLADNCGVKTIIRPNNLCKDDSTSESALHHAIECLKDDHHIHSVEVVFRIPGRIAYTTCRAKWLPKAFDSPLGSVQRQTIKYHFNTQADTRWETVTFWTDCSMSQLKLNLHRQGKETHIKSIVANVSPRSNSRP